MTPNSLILVACLWFPWDSLSLTPLTSYLQPSDLVLGSH